MNDIPEARQDDVEAKIARLIEEVERLDDLNDRLPLIVLMREQLQKYVFSFIWSPTLWLIMGLGGVAIVALFMEFKALWISIPAIAVLLFALVVMAAMLRQILPRVLGLYLTRFLILTQHDRAIAGLRHALIGRHPIILYLRAFESEQRSSSFLALEHQLVDAAHDAVILVSLVNPASDPSLRLSSIPKFMYPLQTWDRLVELLCIRADRIMLAADTISEGVQVELGMLAKLGVRSKTMFVNMGQARCSSPALDAAVGWQIDQPTGPLLFCDETRKWLGELAFVSQHGQKSTLNLTTARRSRALGFAMASLYLLGVRSLGPQSDHALYRRWLWIRSSFDPLQKMRDEVLATEERAYAAGLAVRPLDLYIDGDEFKKWNANKRLLRQLETASMLLIQRKPWKRIRQVLRGENHADVLAAASWPPQPPAAGEPKTNPP